MRTRKLYIETFGCQMNVNDSERIVSQLREIGYEPSSDKSSADLILFNTCSVRSGAEEKVYNHLANFSTLKRSRPDVLIGVGGCVAQQEGEKLLEAFPFLDLVIGTHNLHLLKDMVRDAEAGNRRCETDFIDSQKRLDLFPSVDGEAKLSRFVTVMQGCDNFCSYCIVPYVRGREVSRRPVDILDEIRELVSRGVQEIVLLGQNVNSYGVKGEGDVTFAALLRSVAAVDGLRRIRFTTSHPKDMSDDLIACFAELPSLCGQIQLPAQSGSDAVLTGMNRGYTRAGYLDKIRRLRKARPGIQITGDIIVGFPGETEEDFQQTMALLEEVRYLDIFSFVYSPRPGTKAAELPDDLPRKEKLRRLDAVQELQRRITREQHEAFVGTVQSVLVEGPAKRAGQMSGRADSGRIVNFAGDPSLAGSFVDVTIIEAYQNSLLGEVL